MRFSVGEDCVSSIEQDTPFSVASTISDSLRPLLNQQPRVFRQAFRRKPSTYFHNYRRLVTVQAVLRCHCRPPRGEPCSRAAARGANLRARGCGTERNGTERSVPYRGGELLVEEATVLAQLGELGAVHLVHRLHTRRRGSTSAK